MWLNVAADRLTLRLCVHNVFSSSPFCINYTKMAPFSIIQIYELIHCLPQQQQHLKIFFLCLNMDWKNDIHNAHAMCVCVRRSRIVPQYSLRLLIQFKEKMQHYNINHWFNWRKTYTQFELFHIFRNGQNRYTLLILKINIYVRSFVRSYVNVCIQLCECIYI